MRFNISKEYRQSRDPHLLKFGDGVRSTFMDLGTLHIERSDETEERRRKQHAFASGTYKILLCAVSLLPLILAGALTLTFCDIFKTARRSIKTSSAPTQYEPCYFDASDKEFTLASAFAHRLLYSKGGSAMSAAAGPQELWAENMPPQMREPARRALVAINSPGDFQVFKVEVQPSRKPSYRIVLKGPKKDFLVIKCIKSPAGDSLKLVSACIVSRERWL